MLVEIKDLKVGDEIIVPSNSFLKYLKILRLPMLKKGFIDTYKGIKCSGKRVEVTKTSRTQPQYTWKKVEWVCSPDEHNVERFENLNRKTIWLVKRQGE